MTRLPIVLLLPTVTMMDWSAVGVVVACLWCGMLLAVGVWKIFNAESRCARAEGIGSPERSEPEGPQGAASRRGRRAGEILRKS